MDRLDELRLPDGRGHYATHRVDGAVHELVRDPVGVHKLFFGLDEGRLESATWLVDLRERGWPPEQLWSVPSGHRLRVDLERRSLRLEEVHVPRFVEDDDRPIATHATQIRECLDETFALLDDALGRGPRYVTLSGGLDSTGVAVLAAAHLGVTDAITFAIDGEQDDASGDLAAARHVAGALGLDLTEVLVTREAIAERVDDALLWGQDWRDFNVHCALVNLALADALPSGATVLTGDGMNELMADYSPVAVEGRVLYGLPRLAPGTLRRHLVRGLDTGDREVGVFGRRGIRTVQPYLLCADAYAALPDRYVASAGSKQALVRHVLGDAVPARVYDRPKVRAQVGSSERVGGTVRALLDAGLDQARLKERFRTLYGMTERDQRRLVRAGVYRFPTEWPLEPTHR